MKLHQFLKLYGALMIIDLIGLFAIPAIWNLPPRAMEAYSDAIPAAIVTGLMLNAVYAPMFWFIFVPFVDRESRNAVAFWFGVIFQTIGITSMIVAGPAGFENTMLALKGISLIAFAVGVVGLIVWACGERKWGKESDVAAELAAAQQKLATVNNPES
jgi:hypothetical protein